VTALSNITGVKAKYLGMPSMAYEVGAFIIDKNGSLEFSDKADGEKIENVAQCLAREGFIAEEQINATEGKQTADSEALSLCISMPRSSFTEKALENLKGILEAKAILSVMHLRQKTYRLKFLKMKFHSHGLKKYQHQKRLRLTTILFLRFARWQETRNALLQKKRKSQMKNTHLDAFYSALALLAKSIKKNEKYCSEI
jgi:hypothetical protein